MEPGQKAIYVGIIKAINVMSFEILMAEAMTSASRVVTLHSLAEM
jgi:hypothetical protein